MVFVLKPFVIFLVRSNSRRCRAQHHDLVTYTGYTPALIFKAAEFVASKVSESVKTQKDRHLITVMRKYATSRYYNFSEDFESPDAVDIIGD